LVLGDRRKRHVERLGQLVHGGLALREPGQDRTPGRVGERRERLVEAVVVDGVICGEHGGYFPRRLINQRGN